MAVMSDGSYGIPKDICFSFPVTCKDGKWEIVKGFEWTEFSKKMIDITTKELQEERTMALDYLSTKKKWIKKILYSFIKNDFMKNELL